MDEAHWIAEYGPFGLALLAFLGATLLPFSSEIAVAAALRLGLAPLDVLLWASLGNAAGASLNYALGWAFSERIRHRMSRDRAARRALDWTERYGAWGLLGSWLPVVGDPLCLAAGLFRIRWTAFLALGIGTRVARYAVLVLTLAGTSG